MRAINISAQFILRFVHSVVGLDYYPWKRHTRILAPPEITAPRFASNLDLGQID